MIQDAGPWTSVENMNARDLFGYAGQGPTYGSMSPLAHLNTDDYDTGWRALVNPHNPLFWFGVVLGATALALGAAGSIKLGPAEFSAKVGK